MTRTAAKNKPKHRNSKARRQSEKELPNKPDLRQVFRDARELLDAVLEDREIRRTFERLLSDGCAPGALLSLIQACVEEGRFKASHKKDLDLLKIGLDRVIGRLDALRTDVLSLGTTRIGLNPLRSSSAFDSIDARVQVTFARDYLFTELPGSLDWAKLFLEELKQFIAEEHSVRNQTAGWLLAWLYLYCCTATGRLVTYRETADLLNAGLIAKGSEDLVDEATVRMRLNRFKNSATAMSYENLELLMKDYVRSRPAGAPTLWDWFSSNGAAWVSSHIQPMVPGKVISEKERRRLKLAERERPQE